MGNAAVGRFVPAASQLCRPCLRRFLHASRTSALPKQRAPDSPSRLSKPRQQMVPPGTFAPYQEKDMKQWQEKYTKEQLDAIQAGEEAIDPRDLAEQGIVRNNDPFLPDYDDDFSKYDLVMDYTRRAPKENFDPTSRLKTEEEMVDELADFIKKSVDSPEMAIKQPDGMSDEDFEMRIEKLRRSGKLKQEDLNTWLQNFEVMTGSQESIRNPVSYLAPPIPRGIPSLTAYKAKPADNQIDPRMDKLVKKTGLDEKEIISLRTKVLITKRVVNMTRMGKIPSIYTLTVVGNQKGMMGIGEGKSFEFEEARWGAFSNAVKNMVPIPRYEYRTIYGDVKAKVGGCDVELYNRPPGFGIRCQHLVWEICKCAGISDLAARVGRSRNKMNAIKATMKALLSQKLPEDVAMGLGRKLVDVRKVYYAGNV